MQRPTAVARSVIDPKNRLVKTEEVSAATGIPIHTLRRYLRQGLIPSVWIGQQRRVRLGDLEMVLRDGLGGPRKPGRAVNDTPGPR
jgi:helix-turn-helix protein